MAVSSGRSSIAMLVPAALVCSAAHWRAYSRPFWPRAESKFKCRAVGAKGLCSRHKLFGAGIFRCLSGSHLPMKMFGGNDDCGRNREAKKTPHKTMSAFVQARHTTRLQHDYFPSRLPSLTSSSRRWIAQRFA